MLVLDEKFICFLLLIIHYVRIIRDVFGNQKY